MNSPAALFARSHYFFASLVAIIFLLVASVALADIVTGAFTTNSSTNVTITNLTMDKPSGVVQGDVMLASVAIHDGSTVSVAPPSGWTQVLRTDNDANVSIVTYWKAAGASEPTNYTWTLSPQTRAEGGITRYSGVDNTDPIDTAAGNFSRSKVATTSPITTTAANEKIVAVYALHVGGTNFAGNFFSPPTDMTEIYDRSYTAAGPSLASFDTTQVAAGVADSKSSTISGNPNQQRDWASQQIALRPAGSSGIALDSADPYMREVDLTTTWSFDHTTSGSNRILFAFIETTGPSHAADMLPAGAVQYNGVLMTRANTAPFGGQGGRGYLYYLIAPSIGTHPLTITSETTTNIRAFAVSYTGASQSPILDASSTDSGTASSGSGTVTTQANNAWIVMGNTNGTYSPTAGADTVIRTTADGAGFGYFDSGGPVGAPGTHSLNWNLFQSGEHATLTASFAPAL